MSRTSTRELNARIQMQSAFLKDIIAETGRVLVGQEVLVNRMLIGLLCNGHLLIEGVPGLAKTLAVRTLANTLSAEFPTHSVYAGFTPCGLNRYTGLSSRHKRVQAATRSPCSATSSSPMRSTAPRRKSPVGAVGSDGRKTSYYR